MYTKERLAIQLIDNGFTDDYGDAIKVSYVDKQGKVCFVELCLSDSGCMVIGADGDEKYTF